MAENDNGDIANRVGKVEASLSDIGSRVQGLETETTHLTTAINHLIEQLSQKSDDRTPVWLGIAISVAALVGAIVLTFANDKSDALETQLGQDRVYFNEAIVELRETQNDGYNHALDLIDKLREQTTATNGKQWDGINTLRERAATLEERSKHRNP